MKTKGAFGGKPRRKDTIRREYKVDRRLRNPAISVGDAAFDSQGNNILKRKDGTPFYRY